MPLLCQLFHLQIFVTTFLARCIWARGWVWRKETNIWSPSSVLSTLWEHEEFEC
jgi:hypothetical protein